MKKLKRYNVTFCKDESGTAVFNLSLNPLGNIVKANNAIDIIEDYRKEIFALKMELEIAKEF
jgi:hypothetical protein